MQPSWNNQVCVITCTAPPGRTRCLPTLVRMAHTHNSLCIQRRPAGQRASTQPATGSQAASPPGRQGRAGWRSALARTPGAAGGRSGPGPCAAGGGGGGDRGQCGESPTDTNNCWIAQQRRPASATTDPPQSRAGKWAGVAHEGSKPFLLPSCCCCRRGGAHMHILKPL